MLLKRVNFLVWKLYVIKAVFKKGRQGYTCPPSLIAKLDRKQNGPVKHFKGTLVVFYKYFLTMLVINQSHSHLLIPCYGPVLEVTKEEMWGEGVTQMPRKWISEWRPVIVKSFRGGNWRCPLLRSSFLSQYLLLWVIKTYAATKWR